MLTIHISLALPKANPLNKNRIALTRRVDYLLTTEGVRSNLVGGRVYPGHTVCNIITILVLKVCSESLVTQTRFYVFNGQWTKHTQYIPQH